MELLVRCSNYLNLTYNNLTHITYNLFIKQSSWILVFRIILKCLQYFKYERLELVISIGYKNKVFEKQIAFLSIQRITVDTGLMNNQSCSKENFSTNWYAFLHNINNLIAKLNESIEKGNTVVTISSFNLCNISHSTWSVTQ